MRWGLILLLSGLAATAQTTNPPVVRPITGIPNTNYAAQQGATNPAFAGGFFKATTGNTMTWSQDLGTGTNVNGSEVRSGTVAGQRLGLSTKSVQGAVTTNHFEMLSIPSMSRRSMLRTPMLGIDLWHGSNGRDWTDLEASNYISIIGSKGLDKLGWKYIQFTDGLWGGRTNLHLKTRKPPTQANVHDITNLIKHAWANGVVPGVYSEEQVLTSAAAGAGSGGYDTPQTNSVTGEQPLTGLGAYIEIDAQDWAAMGIGYIQWDVHGPADMDERMYFSRRMAAACQAVAKSNPPTVLRASSFLNYDNGLTNFDANLPKTALNSWRGTWDGSASPIFPNSWDGGWQQAVYEYAFWSRYNYTVEPGGNYYFDSPTLGAITQGQQQTNQTIGNFAMWAMACSDVMVAQIYDDASPAQYRFLTNRYWLAISQDPLVKPASCVITNTDYSIWTRPLADGSQALMMLNHKTNNNTGQTLSIAWTNIGWNATDLVQVRDVLGDSNLVGVAQIITNITGGITRNVGYESAALFILKRESTLISASPVRAPFRMTAADLIGSRISGVDWVNVSSPADPFNRDCLRMAANANPNNNVLAIQVPPWASSMIVTYYAAADNTRNWTNRWVQEYYDGGTRGFGSAATYNVSVTGTAVSYQSNYLAFSPTGLTNCLATIYWGFDHTNSANNTYIMGPVDVTFQ